MEEESSHPLVMMGNTSGLSDTSHERTDHKLFKRLVKKSGKYTFETKSSSLRFWSFMVDISNTLIESHWIWISTIILVANFGTWFIFTGIWMSIAIEYQDHFSNDTCFDKIDGFWGYFMFSMETQTTLGTGERYIHETCPETSITLCAQILLGEVICSTLTFIIVLKLSKPRPHKAVVDCFSKRAIICHRDGASQLMFRVRDPCKRHVAETRLSAFFVQDLDNGLRMRSLKLNVRCPLLFWPVEVTHCIDKSSPMFDLLQKDHLLTTKFEIIVALEGISVGTSYMSKATTSYVSEEISWGYKFKKCTIYDKNLNKYVVDHKLFNVIEKIDKPTCIK